MEPPGEIPHVACSLHRQHQRSWPVHYKQRTVPRSTTKRLRQAPWKNMPMMAIMASRDEVVFPDTGVRLRKSIHISCVMCHVNIRPSMSRGINGKSLI